MEAPEKIYLIRNMPTPTALNTTNDCHEKYLQEWYREREKDLDVEYTRTDYAEKVFIIKAKRFLSEIHRVCDITDENGYRIELRELKARFEKYMKGE